MYVCAYVPMYVSSVEILSRKHFKKDNSQLNKSWHYFEISAVKSNLQLSFPNVPQQCFLHDCPLQAKSQY